MRKSANLIERIIDEGGKRGLRPSDIAARSGLTPQSLSRIRKTGRFNADTLERLLAAADCDVTVQARPAPAEKTLSIVAKKLNAGRRHEINPADLKRLLTRFRPSRSAEHAYSHLVGVVEELPIEQLHNLVIEGSATLPALRRIAAYVDGRGPAADWLHGR